ncbi:transmembrane protein 156 isoform X2 [Centrocercus urophasianus]|uniref:transmembrane protein 156 isoform X2 n=1 Tax=Centrocercus urophasianus TaxID=9002 RepID=UPI001C649256|nr:transmembrane protein 156 isoform X2 [Centrocercus urophasianus]
MCLILRKSELFRLALGVLTMFILCLPEFFKVREANTVVVSCMDTCSSNSTTFPLCTFNNSCKRSLQQKRENQIVLLKTIVNHSDFQNIPCICLSSSREQQSNTKYSESESSRDVNVDHHESRSIDKKTKDSSEVNTEDAISFYKYFNFTMLHANEEVEHSTYYILEIHINSSVVRGRSAAEEYLNHSCLMAMISDQNSCMNISLQLKSYVEYPMCMTKIIWLSMIPVVVVLTVSVVIYKIVQENGQNYCKHRGTATFSTDQGKSGCRLDIRTISATKVHLFPAKANEQPIPLTARKILPIIPEQEHCHLSTSSIECERFLRLLKFICLPLGCHEFS